MIEVSHLSEDTVKELDDLTSSLTKHEANSKANVSDSFVHDLEREFKIRQDARESEKSHHDTSGDVIESLMISEYQADSVIAKRSLEDQSDLIVANDGDFLALIGPSCLLLKAFRFKRGAGKGRSNVKLATIMNLTLRCASKRVRDIIINDLNNNYD